MNDSWRFDAHGSPQHRRRANHRPFIRKTLPVRRRGQRHAAVAGLVHRDVVDQVNAVHEHHVRVFARRALHGPGRMHQIRVAVVQFPVLEIIRPGQRHADEIDAAHVVQESVSAVVLEQRSHAASDQIERALRFEEKVLLILQFTQIGPDDIAVARLDGELGGALPVLGPHPSDEFIALGHFAGHIQHVPVGPVVIERVVHLEPVLGRREYMRRHVGKLGLDRCKELLVHRQKPVLELRWVQGDAEIIRQRRWRHRGDIVCAPLFRHNLVPLCVCRAKSSCAPMV